MQVIDYRTTKFVMIPHFEINLRKSVRNSFFLYISLVGDDTLKFYFYESAPNGTSMYISQ